MSEAAVKTATLHAAPLTEAQDGLWYAQALDAANPIFNTGRYLDLRGPLDIEALRAAIEQTADEAEALSLRFEATATGAQQSVDPDHTPRLEVVDLTGAPDGEAQALAAMQRDMETPLNPTKDALAREVLYILGPQRSLWYQRIHHLVIDGYGMGLLAARAAELYAGENGKPLAALAPVWQEDAGYRASARRQDDAAFWRETMSGAPDVVSLAPGRAMSARRAHRTQTDFNLGFLGRLQARAQSANVPWPDVLTALTAAYCRRFSGAEEAVVGMPYMGRLGSVSARVPAMVMNVLPLRLTPDETGPLNPWLAEASKAMIKARKHGRYRSEQLRRDLGLLGGAKRLFGPLINVLPFERPAFAGLEASLHITGTGPVDDITFTFRGGEGRFGLEIEANPDLYAADEAAAHGARLIAWLEAAIGAASLAEVPIATPTEAERELFEFNATAHPVPETTLVTLIEATMRATPDATAVVFEGQSLTYRELDRRSAALAQHLAQHGAVPGERVVVAMPRSIELIIALVASIRAGAAYLPLDLDHPPARLASLIEVSSPKVILAFSDEHGVFGERMITPDQWPTQPTGAAPIGPSPGDPAYVIYTSGSTGAPKGVVVDHQAIVNRLLWMGAHYGFGPADRILQKTPATFDVSVWEFFLSFVTGGTLVVAPPGAHKEPAAIARLIRQNAITALHFVPSMLTAFLADPSSQGLVVHRVFASGEALPADLRDLFHRTVKAELHNLYGPTEAAVDVSYWDAGPDDRANPLPIGWPVWNTSLVILDEHWRPAAPGMVGHLHLGGIQLARGYLGRPDLTEQRFIANPFVAGERLYVTGDVARRRADGAVVYLGRADDQVKIRGLRIELGEIEAGINATGLAQHCAVLAREDRAGDKRLVAYIVPAEGYDVELLRTKLLARLPDYMVPSAFVAVDAFPTTANGKLNRAALPAPVIEMRKGRAPATPTERTIAALFGEVLGLPETVSAEDDFFELGGDSLLAVRLMLRVQEAFGRDPGLGALFDRSKVAELAALVDAEALDFDNGLGPLLRLAEGDERLKPLYLIHPAGGLAWGYRALARALSPRRPVWGLQAPTIDPEAPEPQDIETLTETYVDLLLAQGGRGPWHLGGWSVGGIIAQAMAARLKNLGEEVGLVALLDSYPAECWRAEPEPTEAQALRALIAIAGFDPEQYPDIVTRAQIGHFLREKGGPLGSLPEAAMDGVIRTVLGTNRLIRGHHHRRYEGVLTHVRAALDHKDKPLTPQLWADYAAGLDLVDAPFLHAQLTSPAAVAVIAPALDQRLAAFDAVEG